MFPIFASFCQLICSTSHKLLEVIDTNNSLGIMQDFVISFSVTVLFTFFVRLIAMSVNWVHRPDPNKWKREVNSHVVPITMGGGFAMFSGFAISIILRFDSQFLTVILFSLCAALLGFYDDLRSPRPVYKLAIQILFGIATAAVIGWVHGLPVWLGIPITIFAIVGLMNSVNMMDNMDGVASGLITLSMIGYAILGLLTKNELVMVLGLIVAGTTFGFWIYNKPSATIFMGDTGSLMLGYLLAVTGIMASWGEYKSLFARLVAPLLLASVFIIDTTFVVLWRKTHGLPVMQGDRNHISHRLAILFGHSEWNANLVLYLVQLLVSGAALVVTTSSVLVAIAVSLFVFSLLGLLCWRMWQVKIE